MYWVYFPFRTNEAFCKYKKNFYKPTVNKEGCLFRIILTVDMEKWGTFFNVVKGMKRWTGIQINRLQILIMDMERSEDFLLLLTWKGKKTFSDCWHWKEIIHVQTIDMKRREDISDHWHWKERRHFRQLTWKGEKTFSDYWHGKERHGKSEDI